MLRAEKFRIFSGHNTQSHPSNRSQWLWIWKSRMTDICLVS